MTSATVEEVQARLPELLEQIESQEVVITRDGQPIARLTNVPTRKMKLGRGKGLLISYVEDDEHLEDFGEYMP